MIKISAVIITYNEEKNIGRCLASLAGVIDEIIVVDNLSKDRTKKICETYEVKFFTQEWLGYSKQKNYGNSLASYDWILSIDADEELSKELQNSILNIKKNPSADGYSMDRLTNYCGCWVNHGDWYPDTKLRLWNKNKGEWKGLIHEAVILRTPFKTLKLEGKLNHYSYYSILDHLLQIQNYTELMAKDNFEKGKKSSLLKIIFSPTFKFLKAYFLRMGFLDGYAGFLIAVMSAYATFLKYVRTQELQKAKVDKEESY